jgi:prepilin-type N-terminal cleavage/methylation domain-containing protein
VVRPAAPASRDLTALTPGLRFRLDDAIASTGAEILRREQRGFTLVEIAIVMVLVGLLMGGILKGQEMVNQAKIKSLVADFSGVSAAYYGYQDRYRAVPGDDPNAGLRWAGATSGTGDGQVAGKYNSQNPADESRQWWAHLRRAGFVAGAGTLQPFNAVTGVIGVQTGDGEAAIAPVLNGMASLIVCFAGLPDKMAVSVDTQMDDGVPDKGGMRAQLHTAGPSPDLATAAASGYAETGANVYTLCRPV